MFQNVERYIDFITKNSLSQAQFLMLYLMYRKKYECINTYKKFFPKEDGSMIGKEEKQDLLERGFLIQVGNENKVGDYIVGEQFTKIFLANIHEAANQFWDKYPGFVKINGTDTPLTNMDRYKFAVLYGERIDYSVEEHIEVLKDLDYGVSNGLIRMNIENFVRSEQWKALRKNRLNVDTVKTNINLSNNF